MTTNCETAMSEVKT